MTARRRLEQRLEALSEISEIMESLKTLSLMETRKLLNVLQCQRRVIDGIEAVARDFLAFHPAFAEPRSFGSRIWIVIGAERGFCGDFNEALVGAAERQAAAEPGGGTTFVAVGRKLVGALGDRLRPAAVMDGPSVVEDVPQALQGVVEITNRLVGGPRPMTLGLLHHDDDAGTIRVRSVLPPFGGPKTATAAWRTPPRLYLSPERFYADLVDHYVFASLHQAFYLSLMAEHQRRFRHLDGAVTHMEDRIAELGKKRNALRQEEITEEIELILLSSRSARPG